MRISKVKDKKQQIEDQVVDMYEKHPFPSASDPFRKMAEEMEIRLKLLGLKPDDFSNKKILDVGCGTGEYTCWYSSKNNEVTGIDLSRSSLERARSYAKSYDFKNVQFQRASALDLPFPDHSFDLTYSMGVLHHTPDPLKGFSEMVRVTRPGGIIIVSVYNKFGRLRHNLKQKWINMLAGPVIDERIKVAKKWFPRTCKKLKKRARSDSDITIYNALCQPYESQHSVGEILSWFDQHGLDYLGAFGPVTIKDNLLASQLLEFKKFEESFEAFPFCLQISELMRKFARVFVCKPNEDDLVFKRPSLFSRGLVQIIWFVLGFPFSIFTLSARKTSKTTDAMRSE